MKICYQDKFVIVKKKKRKNKEDLSIVKLIQGVVIAPVTNANKIILIKQYREALGQEILELPAGLRDKTGETILQTAKRELLEETGYTAKTWIPLGKFSIAPNIIATQPFIFLAIGAQHKPQLKLEEEFKHAEYAFEEIEELVRRKQLTDAVSIAAIYATKSYLKL